MLNNSSEVVNFLTIYRPWFNAIIYPLTANFYKSIKMSKL